jgi:hypothetical protein
MIAFVRDPNYGWDQIKRQVDMRDRLIRELILTAERLGIQIIYEPLGKSYSVKLSEEAIAVTPSVGGVLRVLEAYFLAKGILPCA